MSLSHLSSRCFARFCLLILASTSAACNAEETTPVAHNADVLLQTLDIDPAQKETLTLLIAPCTEQGCPLELQLRRAGQTLDTAVLDWPTSSQHKEQTQMDAAMGAVLPMGTAKGTAWITGQEEQDVSVAFERIDGLTISPLILVHQQGGYEHVKRRHYLYTVKAHRLKRLWLAAEGAGAHWLTVAPYDGRIYYYDGFYEPSLAFNPLKIYQLTFTDEDKVSLSTAPQLYAVSLGPFASAESASERQASSDCLYDFSILPSAQLGLAPGKAVLAALTPDAQLAKTGAASLKECLGDVTPQILTVDPIQFNLKAFSAS